MVRSSQLARRIRSVDWDFQGALSSYGLHRLHWYPATFIPQIPAYLIELFSADGDIVYDPFCGVGTSLLEAVRLGRRAIGTDVNDIAVMIAQAKLTFFRPKTLRILSSEVHGRVLERSDAYGLESNWSLFSKTRDKSLPLVNQRLSILKPWYHSDTWRQMLVLHELIGEYSGSFRRLLDVVFSGIAKRCSGQRHHWGYVADNMVPTELHYEDAIGVFLNALNDVVDAFERFLALPELHGAGVAELNSRTKVMRANVLDGPILDDNSVDLIVTSPPYPNVTDYTRAQRLSLWWFEKSVDEIREREIGARYKRSRQTALSSYFAEMEICVQNITRSLLRGKYLCLVVGESAKYQSERNVVNSLCSMILKSGFEMPFDRIKRNRSRQRLKRRDGDTNDEFILFFRKK